MNPMFPTVLLALDGSPLAERALPYAEELACAAGAQLLLVRAVAVHPVCGPAADAQLAAAVREAEAYLDELAAGLARRGLAVGTAVPRGPSAGDAVVDEAYRQQADLVVLTTHGQTGLGRWEYGSAAEVILARAPAPVLLLRSWLRANHPEPPGDRPRLLVPLDGSPFAEAGLVAARRLARLLGGELVLCRAGPQPPLRPVRAPADAWLADYLQEEELDARRAAALGYLQRQAHRLAAQGYPARVHLTVGEPAEAIAAAAREEGASLVVMATHGIADAYRLLLGSVAEGVLRCDETPLLLVRPEDESVERLLDPLTVAHVTVQAASVGLAVPG